MILLINLINVIIVVLDLRENIILWFILIFIRMIDHIVVLNVETNRNIHINNYQSDTINKLINVIIVVLDLRENIILWLIFIFI